MNPTLKAVIVEAVKIGSVVAVVLGVLAALLPAAHFPATDTVIVTGAAAVVAGFLKWAKEHGYAAKVAKAVRGY